MGGKIILIFIFFNLITVKSQSLDVFYEVDFRSKKSDTLRKKEDVILLIDTKNKVSSFGPSEGRGRDKFNTYIQKKYTDGRFFVFKPIMLEYYKTEYDFHSKWLLLDDEKKISIYNCRKAVIEFGERTWEAWYTPELAFADGPYKFSGLPGLILSIESTDGDYIFKFKGIEKSKNENILPSATPLNTGQLNQLIQKTLKDPSHRYRMMVSELASSGHSVTAKYNGRELSDKDTEKSLNDNFWNWLKNNDNPIEKNDIWTN